MKTMTVTFESGKQYRYTGKAIELMTMKMRIKENEERRGRLGMEIDKAVKFEIEESIY